MSRKLLSATATICLLGGLALAAPAGAGSAAKTTVTIIPQSGGFFGYVYSPKPQKCANNRVVKLYKQKGATQKPATDALIGSDIAQPNGPKYMWSTGNTGFQPGKFYARATRKPGCLPDSSKSVNAQR